MTIHVQIIDDHEMVRLGMRTYLNIQSDIEVVQESEDGDLGLRDALSVRPDVILMDVVMNRMDGIEATKGILKEWPEAKILIITSFLDDDKLYPAIEAGAYGYILKTSSADEIVSAVRRVYKGEKVVATRVTAKMRADEAAKAIHQLHDDLTARENDVLKLIAQGYSNQEIADSLFITLKTVKTHVSNILSKLEVADRTQAAIYAFRHDLVKDK